VVAAMLRHTDKDRRLVAGARALSAAKGGRQSELRQIAGAPGDGTILAGVAVALRADALHHVDAVELADDGLAAALGVAEVAEVVLLLVAEGSGVRDVPRDLDVLGGRGVLRGRVEESPALTSIVEQVDAQVRVARTDDLTVLLSHFITTRVGSAEVEVSDLAAIVDGVFLALGVLFAKTETYVTHTHRERERERREREKSTNTVSHSAKQCSHNDTNDE
jgi:hypothetical protein